MIALVRVAMVLMLLLLLLLLVHSWHLVSGQPRQRRSRSLYTFCGAVFFSTHPSSFSVPRDSLSFEEYSQEQKSMCNYIQGICTACMPLGSP